MHKLLFLLLACSPEIGISKGYTNPAEEDTSITDSKVFPSPTEEPIVIDTGTEEYNGISGYTNLHLRQVACPACVGIPREITVEFEADFHLLITQQPANTPYHTLWLPSVGECITNIQGVNPSHTLIDLGQSISIYNPAHNFIAERYTQDGHYENNNISEVLLQRNSVYDITTDIGGYTYEITTIEGFDFIEPYTMLWTDPAYAFEAPIYRSGATFTWGPVLPDTKFLIVVDVYSWDGSQLLGSVSCLDNDTGVMTVPGQYLQSYPAGSLVAIHLSRQKIELVETNINSIRSYIETHIEWTVIGTGMIY
tara:strand:+ start:1910 stop:2836 length:927 start_codon:yes stop_codon:yes gene_type:complete